MCRVGENQSETSMIILKGKKNAILMHLIPGFWKAGYLHPRSSEDDQQNGDQNRCQAGLPTAISQSGLQPISALTHLSFGVHILNVNILIPMSFCV